MAAPYARRRIDVTFQLRDATRFSDGSSQVKVGGLRAQAVITHGGMPTPSEASLVIWGMTLDQIDKISDSSRDWYGGSGNKPNGVLIEAGDDTKMTTVFNGVFRRGTPKFNDGPNTALEVVANGSQDLQFQASPPVSMRGGVDVDTFLRRILQPAGYTLDNRGVKATLRNPYFPGTVWQQVLAAVRAVGCLATADSIQRVLRIWPNGRGDEAGGTLPLVSPATGMIGYPEFDNVYMTVRSVFDPSLRGPGPSGIGTMFRLESQLPSANGTWRVNQIDYVLSSELPGGPWEMMIQAVRAGNQPTVPYQNNPSQR